MIGGPCSVMVIMIRNECSDPNSNPEQGSLLYT